MYDRFNSGQIHWSCSFLKDSGLVAQNIPNLKKKQIITLWISCTGDTLELGNFNVCNKIQKLKLLLRFYVD